MAVGKRRAFRDEQNVERQRDLEPAGNRQSIDCADNRLRKGRDGIDHIFARDIVLHAGSGRSEEHTSELQSLMRISYAVFCLKKKIARTIITYLFNCIDFVINR